ncbi:helix-turn-helix domain-containing protein [Isoptericola sp. AK164]|uniref:GlxA family transcriptional regulator n=1 Tax=Isoptericola sp. AK164 TaxID=3024246 RepID=UPI00241881CF|nr:helix-turn-helix domain-containing protein [Isoptericola sp. AK164]
MSVQPGSGPARRADAVSRPHRVAVLVRPGVMPLELGLCHQLFGRARDADGRALYTVTTCAPAPGPVPTDADFTVDVAAGPEALAAADTVVVLASHAPGETETTGTLGPDLAAAWDRVRPGARLASICTGAYVLAAAGVLDGRRATTHWNSAADLARRFPAVQVDPDVLFVDTGDVLTSAGEAAGIDLCLHLIRRDHGAAVANDVARAAVVPPYREGGQAQYIPRPAASPHGPVTASARAWALDRLDQDLSLASWAAAQALSVRTLTRRLAQETGLSPWQWLTAQRVARARELLESTDLSVDRVAAQVGFGTAVSLRTHLHERLGVTPSAYRATFRGPAAKSS